MKTWMCPKCGDTCDDIEWRGDSKDLLVTCRCGFFWFALPLDATPPDHVADDSHLGAELRRLLNARSLSDLCDWLDQHEEWPVASGNLRAAACVLEKAAPPDHVADELTDGEVIASMALYEPSSRALDALRNVARVASAHCNGKADHMAIRHALAALQGHESSLNTILDADPEHADVRTMMHHVESKWDKLWRVATAAEAHWGDTGCGNAARLRDALDELNRGMPQAE